MTPLASHYPVSEAVERDGILWKMRLSSSRQSSPFTSPTVILLVDGGLSWIPGIGGAMEVEIKGAEGRELFLCGV